MRHHFGDLLDRDGGYWTITPNRERYAYRIGDVAAGSKEVTIVTIGKADEHWARAPKPAKPRRTDPARAYKDQLLAMFTALCR